MRLSHRMRPRRSTLTCMCIKKLTSKEYLKISKRLRKCGTNLFVTCKHHLETALNYTVEYAPETVSFRSCRNSVVTSVPHVDSLQRARSSRLYSLRRQKDDPDGK